MAKLDRKQMKHMTLREQWAYAKANIDDNTTRQERKALKKSGSDRVQVVITHTTLIQPFLERGWVIDGVTRLFSIKYVLGINRVDLESRLG